LDTLGNCLNRSLLRKALKTLPSTLDKTYERILNNINNEYSEYAIRILQWLAFSERPLSIHEIAEVVAIDTSRDPEFDPEEVLEDPLDALKICSSLVTTRKTSSFRRLYHGVQRMEDVVLAHYSVKEFLLSDRIQQGPAARYGLQAAVCHKALAMACLGYLNQFQNTDAIMTKRFQDFMLARYSAKYWHVHALKTGDQTAEADRLVLRLLSIENRACLNWIRIHDPDVLKNKSRIPKPLYYASLLGLEKAVSSLLAQGADVKAIGGTHHDALQASIIRGHENIVKILLSAGADVNARSGDYWNLLRCAMECRNEGIVKILLEAGANVGPDKRLKGALHHAVDRTRCTPSLASMLIEFGAPTSTVDVENMTPLHYCVKHNHITIAAQLIDANVPVDIRVHRGGRHTITKERTYADELVPPAPQGVETGLTPLHFAALSCNFVMTKLLLGYGADPNVLSDYHETPLHLTLSDRLYGQEYPGIWFRFSDWRKASFIELDGKRFDALAETQNALLEDSRTSPNMKDYKGESLLHYVRYGRPDSATQVRRLLSSGADPNCCNLRKQTPLHFASGAGDHESVEVLIDMGGEVGQEDNNGLNALHYAAQNGSHEIIMAILGTEEGRAARLGGSKDRSGRNALHHLLNKEIEVYIPTVRLLLSNGADSWAVDNSGNTPLGILAWRNSYEPDCEIWRCLLGIKGNESWSNDEGQNFGHLCCLQREVDVRMLSILNECGVDLSKKDCEGKTALHIAAIRDSLDAEIMIYLVHVVGLRVTEKDSHGQSALQYANKWRSGNFGRFGAPETSNPMYELMDYQYRKRKKAQSLLSVRNLPRKPSGRGQSFFKFPL